MKTGDALKNARVGAGITQAELAKRLGVTPQTVSQYERGRINPKFETLLKFSAALGIDFTDLVDQTDYVEDENGELLISRHLRNEVVELDKELDEIGKSSKGADVEQLKRKLERAGQIQERLNDISSDMEDARLLTRFHKLADTDKEKVISYCQWLADTMQSRTKNVPDTAGLAADDAAEDEPKE